MVTKVNQTELFKTAFREMMKSVGTSIPGHIVGFDKDTQLAQVQIGIEQVDVNGKRFEPAPLIEVPLYVYGGAFSVECQIDNGTEGLIIFSQRCIDGWNDTGGIAKNPILRFHDSSDAFFLPGMRSQPNKIASFENNGVRLRNEDGSQFIWLKNDGTAEITVTTLNINGNIVHTGNITHDGDQTTTGTITGDTDVIGGGKSLKAHTHSGSATAPNGPVTPTGAPV